MITTKGTNVKAMTTYKFCRPEKQNASHNDTKLQNNKQNIREGRQPHMRRKDTNKGMIMILYGWKP